MWHSKVMKCSEQGTGYMSTRVCATIWRRPEPPVDTAGVKTADIVCTANNIPLFCTTPASQPSTPKDASGGIWVIDMREKRDIMDIDETHDLSWPAG